MRPAAAKLALLASVLAVAACGGRNGTEPTEPPNFSGNYTGKIRYFDPANPGTYADSTNVTVAIQQPIGSTQLSGSWSTPVASGGLLGTVNARFEGSVDLAIQQAQPCTGSFSGQGAKSTLNGQFYGITFQYNGSDCAGSYLANAELARVP